MLTANGELGIYTTDETENLLTGEITVEVEKLAVPFDPPPGRESPAFLKLAGTANFLYLIWSDGYAIRFDARDEERAEAAETFDLTPDAGSITRVQYMIGKTTLLVGSDTGSVQAWFPTRPDGAETIDGIVTVKAHEMQGPASPVTTLGASARSRLAVAGHADGTVRLLLVSAADEVARVSVPTGAAIEAAVVSSKEGGIVAQSARQLVGWELRAGPPDASNRA